MGSLLVVLNIVVAGGVAVSCYLVLSLRSYATKKGENLATKEDIEEITRLVEAVKHEFALEVEARRMKHDWSKVSVETRLQKHQEAFTRSLALYDKAHDEDWSKVAASSMQWWRENCLYLSPGAARAFQQACTAAYIHQGLLDAKVDQGVLDKNWALIDGAWNTIADEVQLPGIGEAVRDLIDQAHDSR